MYVFSSYLCRNVSCAEQLMRPDPTVAREYGAVYVGAGSNMLKVKPLLTEMLYRSLPHRLRLHGAHWGHDPRLEEAYKGGEVMRLRVCSCTGVMLLFGQDVLLGYVVRLCCALHHSLYSYTTVLYCTLLCYAVM